MEYTPELLLLEKIISASLVVAVTFTDIYFVEKACRLRLELTNYYYKINRRHDYIKTTFYKVVFAISLVDGIFDLTFYRRHAQLFTIFYIILIINFLFRYLQYQPKNTSKASARTTEGVHSRILTILTYPFEPLNSKKKIYVPQTQERHWSWGAFFMPELWFIWHEIWGAGLLALGLFFIYIRIPFMASSSFSLYSTAAVISTVRILFGLVGSRIYFARYGNWKAKSNYLKSKV